MLEENTGTRGTKYDMTKQYSQNIYTYTITYYHRDGTVEEYQIQTERDIDLDGEISYLDEIILQFNNH